MRVRIVRQTRGTNVQPMTPIVNVARVRNVCIAGYPSQSKPVANNRCVTLVMAAPFKATTTMPVTTTPPSPASRRCGLDHAQRAYVVSIWQPTIKSVPGARRLIAFPRKSSHVLKHILAKAETASKFQQLLPGHKSLVRLTALHRRINGSIREKWTGRGVRRIAEIEQISSPCVLPIVHVTRRKIGIAE